MKIVATITARMTSNRLPGKVMLPVLNRPILHYLVERLKNVPSIDGIVLATTVNKTDDTLIDFAINEGISYFRGSEDDVLLRVVEAADSEDADIVVEITGDCPIIDPQLVEQAILMYKANNVDYVSNGHNDNEEITGKMLFETPDGNEVVEPQDGLLLTFSARAHHTIHEYLGDKTRIVISGDLKLK